MARLGQAIVLVLSIFTSACAEQKIVVEPPSFGAPVVVPAPIHADVVYGDDLLRHECLVLPTKATFDRVFRNLFREVEFIEAQGARRFATFDRPLIELSLAHFSGCGQFANRVVVAYSAEVWTGGTQPSTRWLGEGEEAESYPVASRPTRAMRQAIANLIIDFDDDPVVQDWRSGGNR